MALRGDIVDARDVAMMIGLAHSNSVSTYVKRYRDFPSPIYGPGPGRARLWLREDIERWLATRRRDGRSRPA